MEKPFSVISNENAKPRNFESKRQISTKHAKYFDEPILYNILKDF